MTATVQKHPPVGKAWMVPDIQCRCLLRVQRLQLSETADPIEEPLDGTRFKADGIRSQMELIASLPIQCWIESTPDDLSRGMITCMP
ncbi:MAG: Uncharacterised protein [Flavobacteriia bacterium]|nr:MAG: Uncharacterised protein [Flavobacteriia bacterium]